MTMPFLDEMPKGERGSVMFPWDVLPRSAVRDSNGTIWARDNTGRWFDVWHVGYAATFRAKPLPGQCVNCGHNADAHDFEDGSCSVLHKVDGVRVYCDCHGFEVQS